MTRVSAGEGARVATMDPARPGPAEFAALFDGEAPGLLRYLGRRVGPAAPDLLSETFAVAIAGRDGFDPDRGDARGWLYGIAGNLLRRHLRQEDRGLRATARAFSLDAAGDGAILAERVAGQVDAARRVSQLAGRIADLSAGDRDVLLLTAWAELDSAEVAAALNIPVGTVRSRLHRVRRQLRSHEAGLSAAPSSQEVDDDRI
ncbi:sigma-70 family RNA polymerase sigma factor [Nakamurella silvestris]|nr:sigma-70 family RNA polymerase sigma factor [Nakamurella silvestris]